MPIPAAKPNVTGIFGGSFDPPHLGHLGIAESFWREFPEASELLIIPNSLSPAKNEKHVSAGIILDMLHLQFGEIKNTRILDLELQRSGPSYTYDTLTELKRTMPERDYLLLVGEDQYVSFHLWKEWEGILSLVTTLLVFRRTSEIIPLNPELDRFSEKIVFLKNPIVPGASCDLRGELPEAIRTKRKPIALTEAVWQKILETNSYSK
ncbi:nicotinate-nicotinamide nucleotide adenylyltransferase [Leptospira fluminis]|uniref:Probable nicotinate-nucleotide adenylyltransferase n=1 Tax=Leptospira fluminis TaxID=2484979 RepID=A0A4R9GL15_9LEPT|nr:nicotinate-nicotinamide nucleotide adenylyltransferase [Leptospira fluminis]TGK15198.1 nicotinate-nicotinamide nucleotide adenylyltransferase [Leptospira fluminis]